MTLREIIVAVLIETEIGRDAWLTQDQTTDAILAAIREHITTEDALDRASAAYWSDDDLVADIGDVLKKAILAALGDA